MFKKLFSIFISMVMIVSCIGLVSAETEDSKIVRFGVFSDTHNGVDGIKNAFDNIYAFSENGSALDGVVMNGDIVYMQQDVTPAESHYQNLLSNEKYQEMKAAGKLVYEMGNHEFPLNSQENATLTAQALEMFKEQTGFDTQMHTVLSGYHFINAAPENYSGGMQPAEEYMRTELDKALADGNEKPVFLVVHHPVPSSVIDSPGATSTRFSVEFREYLNNQPRIIVLSGHTHEPASDPRSIRQYIGGCTYVQTGHISGGANAKSSYATEVHSKKVCQAMMMEIDPDTNVVSLKPFYVESGEPQYLEQGDWTLDIPAMIKAKETEDTSDDLNAFKYTFEDRNAKGKAPSFEEGSKATVSSISATSANVTFPKALPYDNNQDNMIKFYEIRVFDVDAAQLLKTDVILSDFFLKESERRKEFTHSVLGLSQGTNYKFEILATTTWYKKSAPISVEFATLAEETFDTVTLQADYTYTVKAADISNDNNSVYHRGSYIQVPGTASNHKFTATFNIVKSGMYRFMASSIGSNGAPTYAVISKMEDDGTKTVLKTGSSYIASGDPSTYITNIPYADLVLLPGTYTMTWSIGSSGDTTTLNGLKCARYAPVPAEYLDEYSVEKTAAEYFETSETVEEGTTPESFTLNTDGFVSWQIKPEYTGTYKLSYDFTGDSAKTTVTTEGINVTGENLSTLPENVDVSADNAIDLELLANVTYTFKFVAGADAVTVNGMDIVWQGGLEEETYKFTYNVNTDLAYGSINATNSNVQAHIEKTISVPLDGNYTFSINAGLSGDRTVNAFIGRVKGGSVKLTKTGALDTIENKVIFTDVPLKGGQSYKITIFNSTGSTTIRVSDLVLEMSGDYQVNIDNTTFLASDYNTRGSGMAASMSNKHRMALVDAKSMSYKLKTGAGNYKVYAYCRTYTGTPSVKLSLDGTVISTKTYSWASSATRYELGTIRVKDDEFTLNIALPNTTDVTRLWFYRFELVALDEPEVTMYSGTNADSANIITSLVEGSVTSKAYLPKNTEGENVTMFMAIYEDNRLLKVGTYSVAAKKNSVTAVTVDDIVFEEGKTYTSKVFFWDNENNPLFANPAEGSITGTKTVE